MVTPNRYPVPAAEARAEIRVLNSHFVASLAPASSVDNAREFIARIRRELADATHHVPAYLVGHGATCIAHCHDDGEPSGTAGRPALAVLSGSGLGDVAVVVTRFFGGTKLGTGGLVRAYGDAVRAVLDVTPRGEKVPAHTVVMVVPYSLLKPVRMVLPVHGGELLAEEFGGDVTIRARFAVEDLAAFQAALQQLSNGSLEAEIVETGVVTML